MDPDTCLADVRQLITMIDEVETLARKNVLREHLVNKFRELDEWLSNGGLAPSDWRRPSLSCDH